MWSLRLVAPDADHHGGRRADRYEGLDRTGHEWALGQEHGDEKHADSHVRVRDPFVHAVTIGAFVRGDCAGMRTAML